MSNRKTRATILAAALALTGLFAVGGDDYTFAQESAQNGFKPVMPVLSLMYEQDLHFNRILDLVRDDTVEDRFRKMRHEAFVLAELGNINGYQRLAHDKQDYRGWANDLKTLSIELAERASAKDLAGIKQLARNINRTCKACHDQHQ